MESKESKGRKVEQVLPKYGTCKEIRKCFGVSAQTVTSALKGKTNSRQAELIRALAVDLGGHLIHK